MSKLAWCTGAFIGFVIFSVKTIARWLKIMPPTKITGRIHRIFLRKGYPHNTYEFPKYIWRYTGTSLMGSSHIELIRYPGHIMLVIKESDYRVAERGVWFEFEDGTLRCVRRKFKEGYGGRKGYDYYIEFYRWPPQRIRSKR